LAAATASIEKDATTLNELKAEISSNEEKIWQLESQIISQQEEIKAVISSNEEKIWQLESQIISQQEEIADLKVKLDKLTFSSVKKVICVGKNKTITLKAGKSTCPTGFKRK